MPLVVTNIIPDPRGKFPNSVTNAIVLEFSTFVHYFAPRLHPAIRAGGAPPMASPGVSCCANPGGNMYQYVCSAPPLRFDALLGGC